MSQIGTSGPWERFQTPAPTGRPWERFSGSTPDNGGSVATAQPTQSPDAGSPSPQPVVPSSFTVPGSMPSAPSAPPPEAGTQLYPEDQAAQELAKHTSWLEKAAGAAGQGLDEGARVLQSHWQRMFQMGPAAFSNFGGYEPDTQPGLISPQSRAVLSQSLVSNPLSHAVVGTAAGMAPTFLTPEGLASGPVAGEVTGAASPIAGSVLGRTAGSSAAGAAFMGGGTAIEGKSPEQVATQAAIGAALGAAGHAAGEGAGAGVRKLGEMVDNRRIATMPEEKLADRFPDLVKPDEPARGTPEANAKIKAADDWAKQEADQAEGKFPDKMTADEAASFAADNRRDFDGDTALAKAAEVQHQKKNLDLMDHGDSPFVRVDVPIDQFEVNNKDSLDQSAVDEFAKQSADTAPPVFAGPPKEAGDKPLLLVEGRHRVAAAEARGESTVSAYVPEKWAKEAGLLADARRRAPGDLEAKGTTMAPETSQIDVNAPTPPKPPAPTASAAAPAPQPGPVSSGAADSTNLRVRDLLDQAKGQSFPKLANRDTASGEAANQWTAARMIADARKREIARTVLGNRMEDDGFANKLGAVMTEANLRGDRKLALDAGDTEKAGAVKSLVGPDEFFKTEAEYQAALKDPEIKAAIERDREHGAPVRQALFESASPKTKLHPGGEGGVPHISLMRKAEEGETAAPAGGGQFTEKSLRKKSPFARNRTGAASAYETDYRKLLENNLSRNAPVAYQSRFYDAIKSAGLGRETTWAERPTGPEWGKTFKTEQGRLILADGEGKVTGAANLNRYLTVKKSVEGEVSALAESLGPQSETMLRKVGRALDTANLATGLGEAKGHTVRLIQNLTRSNLVGSSGITRAAGLVGGMPKLAATLEAVARKAYEWHKQTPEVLKAYRELAEADALRPPQQEGGKLPGLGRLIHGTDRAVRLAAYDAHKVAVKIGLAENTPRDLREFVNGIAYQYNRAAQGGLTRAARDSGLGTFATAGLGGNRASVREWLLDPGMKAPSWKGAAMNRALKGLGLAGTFAQAKLLQYMITGQWKNRSGVPPFAFDTGKDDERGKPVYYDLLDLTGLRRGASVFGMGQNLQAMQEGVPLNGRDIADNAMRDIQNTAVHPIISSPALGVASVARTGQDVTRLNNRLEPTQVAPKVGPDSSQAAENLWAAAKHILSQSSEPGQDMPAGARIGETLKSQLIPFRSKAGKTPEDIAALPDKVRFSRTMEYADDLYRRAVQLPPDLRLDLIESELDKQGSETAALVYKELFVKRKVMSRE